MRNYYRNTMVGLGAASVAVMVTTYVAISTYFPSGSQTLASSISIAFEGFIFGGAFQFLLEGRRMQHRDREIRIDAYHKKLKRHVIDFWSSRSLEPRTQLTDKPECRENLYSFIDLDSLADPDHRYLENTLLHLRDKRYAGIIQLRETIKESVIKHNQSVADFVALNASFHENIEALGFAIVNQAIRDPLPRNAFNMVSTRQYLDQYHRGPTLTQLKASNEEPSEFALKPDQRYFGPALWFIWEGSWYRVASGDSPERIDRMSAVLKDFAPEYSKLRAGLEDGMRTIASSTDQLKAKVVPVGYDIEEGLFEGSCAYEERVRT